MEISTIRDEINLAIIISSLVLVLSVGVSYCTLIGHMRGGGGMLAAPLDSTINPLFLSILLRNSVVALGLFSGVLTFGLSSLLNIAFIGFTVGSTTAAAIMEVGAKSVIISVAGYAIIEIIGYILAAASGLVPVLSILNYQHGIAGTTKFAIYIRRIRCSFILLMISLVFIFSGAILETLIIVSRS